ncbi:MAG: protein translocase subunit SecF, partial [Parvibaculales bacterium]
MKTLKLVPVNTSIGFIRHRTIAMVLSSVLVVASVFVFLANGLNFGIDFRGGTLIEASSESAVDLAELRGRLGALDLGEVQIQEFGKETDVLIRIAEKEGATDA